MNGAPAFRMVGVRLLVYDIDRCVLHIVCTGNNGMAETTCAISVLDFVSSSLEIGFGNSEIHPSRVCGVLFVLCITLCLYK